MSRVCSGYKYLGEGKTNNEAEYESVILGLRAAAKLGAKQIVVKGDSMLVIQQVLLYSSMICFGILSFVPLLSLKFIAVCPVELHHPGLCSAANLARMA